MKRQTLTGIACLALAGSLMTSCDLLKDLEYTVTPTPLEMHGDSVRVKVDVQFPAKGIRKKVSAEIQPMLGETALKSITVQGEKATGNGSVIQYKSGGRVTYYDVVPYQPSFEDTKLTITGTVYKGGKEKDKFGPKEIGQGTIITPLLVNNDFKVIMEKDNFNRVTQESYSATINYDKGRSVVKASELKDADMMTLLAWFEKAQGDAKIKLNAINITGYASPEGEQGKNDNLSNERAEAGKEATMKLAKKAGYEAAQGEVYTLIGKGEDYDGFKVELQKSEMNEDDKNLVIRVLEMHKDPVTREEEMRNMGKTFTYLDKNIFPKLRRSAITIGYDQTGYTDEELKNLASTTPEKLTLEEMLFAATLLEDLNAKLKVYKAAQAKFPNDHRAFNNAGGVLFMQNKMAEAKAEFEKAVNINDNPIAKNNLGAVAGVAGDRELAATLLKQGKGSGSENSYNMGILNILDGKYAEAVTNFGSENTFNKALAQLLNESFEASVRTINGSADKESAQGYYLKAIAAARQDNAADAVSNLKSAIEKDGAMKEKAASDKEFLKMAEDANFTSLM